MLRLLIFMAMVALLAWGVVWVADNPGEVAFTWQGWHVETSAGVAVSAVAAFAIVVAAVYRFWLFITRAPGRLGGALKERRRNKGYRALTQGMVAVAAGDGVEANKQVVKADGLLGAPALTMLLKAQAAQLNGDEAAAEVFFIAMLENEETEFLGLRGLLNQAMKAGDDGRALELAHRARALKPKSGWLDDVLFELEGRTGSWHLATETLKRLDKHSELNEAARTRRRAVVAYGRSLEAGAEGDDIRAQKWVQKAYSLDPTLVPAAIRLAEIAAAAGRGRKARATVERTWAISPHPGLLAPLFAGLDAVDGLKRVSAAERLAKINPDHPESHMAIATAALQARLWGQARTHLERAIELGLTTRRVYATMATLVGQQAPSQQAGGQEVARRDAGEYAGFNANASSERVASWLQMAANAPADPAWVCDHCGGVQALWTPLCPKCHGLDCQSWRSPPGIHAIAGPEGPPENHDAIDAKGGQD